MKTKKLLLLAILGFSVLSVNAQFKVNSDGNIGIGGNPSKWQKTVIVGNDHASALSIKNNAMGYWGDIVRIQAKNYDASILAAWLVEENNQLTRTFTILADGTIWAKGQYITSDERAKENIMEITSPLQKIMKIRGVTYNLKSDLKNNESRSALRTTSQLINNKTTRHLGVIAQEVEEVFPEAVRTTEDGFKAVSYTDLVGVLIEAIKEQQVQINDQQAQLEELRQTASSTSQKRASNISLENTTNSLPSDIIDTKNQLLQNSPNPFSSSTKIAYSLDKNVSNASLYIYDMQGKQIKRITNLSKGEGSVVINGHELSAGMYIYTLIADGKEIGTKRMILTN